MTLFGTGMAEAADGCCYLFVFGALLAVGVAAIVGGARGSTSAVVLSFLLAGFVGVVVVPEAVTHELRDTDDSRGVHAMLWQFVWWWAASLCAPVGAAAALLLSGRNPDRDLMAEPSESDPAVAEPTARGVAPLLCDEEQLGVHSEPATFGPRVARFFAVCLLLLAVALLAMLSR